MNNGSTPEANAISKIIRANGYVWYGLPEMKRSEQVYLLRYLIGNEFCAEELNGIAKLFECRLWKMDEEYRLRSRS